MDFDDFNTKPRAKKPQVVAPAQAKPAPKKAVPRQEVVKKSRKPLLFIGIVALIGVVVGIVIFIAARPVGDRPTFSTLLPSGKSIESLGGWKRNSPSENDPAYAYTDTIDGVRIVVSQQPLPDSFKESPRDHLEKAAKEFNATEVIDGVGAYIGTSAKGPQFVLFIKNRTFIMITSEKNIERPSWTRYIQSLG